MDRPEASFAIRYFGQFALLGEIGRGGMGVIHSARQLGLNRRVALKLIHPKHLPTEASRQRLRLEAEVMARLDHPNIASIYEVGEAEGQPFIAMRLVDGGDLAARLASQPGRIPGESARWAPREAVGLVQTVARAVHYAHQQGVVHCDLKPSNILLTDEGTPLVTDFGIARLVGPAAIVKDPTPFMGTANYLAPEHALAPDDPTPTYPTTASDIYSLGVILYQLLTGRLPFAGSSVGQLLRQIRQVRPAPPSAYAGRVDADLDAICLKCLEKLPDQRFPSAAGLANDLQCWLQNKPVTARVAPAWERIRKRIRRSPVVSTLSVLVTVAVIGGVSATVWQSRQARRHMEASARASASLAESLVRLGLRDAEPLLPGGRFLDGVRKLAELLRAQPDNVALRSRLYAALTERRVAWPELPPLLHEAPVVAARFSPGATWLVTAAASGRLTFWDRASGERRLTLPHSSVLGGFDLAREDRLAATLSTNGSVQVWRLPGGELAFELPKASPSRPAPASSGFFAAEFDAAGEWLAVGQTNGAAALHSALDGRQVAAFNHGEPLRVMRVAPDGRGLLTCGPTAGSLWRTAPAGAEANQYPGPALTCNPAHPTVGAGFSANGRRFHTFGGTVAEVWDAATGDRIQQFRFNATVRCAALSADGRWFACGNAGNRAHLYDVASGNRVGSSLHHEAEVVAVDFDRAAARLVTASEDGRAFVWLARTATAWCAPVSHARRVHSAELSRNGDFLLTASDDYTARLWSVNQPVERNIALVSGVPTTRLVLAGDGRSVADVSTRGKVFFFGADGLPGRAPVTHEAALNAVEFSPDGNWLASGDSNGWVSIASVHDKRTVLTADLAAPVSIVSWSPDSTAVALACSNSVQVLWPGAGRRRPPVNLASADPRSLQLARGGGRVLVLNGETELNVANLADAAPQWRTLPTRSLVRAASLSEDGRAVAASFNSGSTRVWDVSVRKALPATLPVGSEVTSLVFGADSTRVVSGDRDGKVCVWNLGQQLTRRELLQHSSPVVALALSPDAQWVASVGSAGGLRLTHSHSGLPGCSPLPLGSQRGVRFSSDGRYLLVQSTPPIAASARRIELPWAATPATDTLVNVAEYVAGQRLDATGLWTDLTTEEFLERRRQLVSRWGQNAPPPRTINYR